MKSFTSQIITIVGTGAAIVLLPSCEGILPSVYDEPATNEVHTVDGRLYIDASDWLTWHYIDFDALADSVGRNPLYNTSGAWVEKPIPTDVTADATDGDRTGIYTYWYDVFGAGISNYEFRSFAPTASQPEPERWSFAVHRNNLRTNGGAIAATDLRDISSLTLTSELLESLDFVSDTWNETDVWVNQDRMLSGIIGNQGIAVNAVGSSWLRVDIPPMPPAFTLDSSVLILRAADGTYGALQLADYQSPTGTKCCLTINYRYPLPVN